MPSLPDRVDLLVVGAGSAGAALAAHAAGRGLRVLCLDRHPLRRAGAHWINGVTRSAFREAEIPLPRGDELAGLDGPFHLLAGYGPHRVQVEGHGVLEVDMARLVARLQDRAREAGATLLGDVRVESTHGWTVRTSAGTVRAETIADASGLSGAGLLRSPLTPRRDLCAAAQAVFEVRDPHGARAFLERYGVAEDQTLCFTGVAGGYSILNVRVHAERVSILTGSIPADGHPAGGPMIERFVADEPWIGKKHRSGQRAIPLGRPHHVLARGRIAALGDAARQVFAAHGSGVGSGMIAARLLADTLAEGGSPERYAVRWMRRWGGLHASYDAFRRFSQTLSPNALEALVREGLVDGESAAAGLAQRYPRIDLARAVAVAPRLAGLGRLSARIGVVGARMAAASALYAAYPGSPRRRRGWIRAVARLT